jgi:hypothetical protein
MKRLIVKAIQDLVRRPAGRVKLTKALKSIHEEYSVGTLIGTSFIIFSNKELDRLRVLAESAVIIDPLHGKIDLPRGQLAQFTNNEKLTSHSVFEDMLQVARHSDTPIKTSWGTATTPRYSLLSVRPQDISLEEENVVIIENGDTMRNWPDIKLPRGLHDSLLIYRGHASSAKYIREKIRCHPENKLYAYFDFDPSGVSKALSLEIKNIIVPYNWEEIQNNHVFKFNKTPTFWKQIQDLNQIESHHSLRVREIATHMKSHNIALTQEHLTAHNIDLTVLDIN